MTRWYYMQDGDVRGPVSADKLQDLAGRGIVSDTTPVWRVGSPDWLLAGKIDGLLGRAVVKPQGRAQADQQGAGPERQPQDEETVTRRESEELPRVSDDSAYDRRIEMIERHRAKVHAEDEARMRAERAGRPEVPRAPFPKPRPGETWGEYRRRKHLAVAALSAALCGASVLLQSVLPEFRVLDLLLELIAAVAGVASLMALVEAMF